ncbi:phage antirepressor [Alloprevotella tannerae]
MNVTIFNNPQFGEIRTAGTPSEPLFCLADVCKALGLSAKGVNQRLEDGVTSHYPITDRLGREQQALFVTEDGLYDVILDSRKPEARAFRKWVTSDVLPTIRRTGGYIKTTEEMTDIEILAKAMLVAQNTIEKRNERIAQLEAENDGQKQLIAQMKKGNDYLNAILASKGTITMTQIAADYGMSAQAMNRRLKDMRIQRRVNGQWILYSCYMAKGFVHSRTISFTRASGRQDTRMQTEWTQRGRLFLYDALKEIGILPLIERQN